VSAVARKHQARGFTPKALFYKHWRDLGIYMLRCKNEKQSCLLFLSVCFKKHRKPSRDWHRPALFEPRRSSGTTDRGKAS
jgi:hypothetical protein